MADDKALGRLLLVEDERDLLELLRYNLVREGFEVEAATSGEAALQMVDERRPDLILLDLMLPAMDGLEVCRSLKQAQATADIPVIMVTAKGEESDVVRGLEMGADDYVTKPFSPRVLLARIKAALRRSQSGDDDAASTAIVLGELTIDLDRHECAVAGHRVELTATEFKLITQLTSRPGRVFTRQQLIEAVHDGFAAVTDRSIDVQVVALRRKLGELGSNIETVRGVGYRYRDL